MVALKPSAGWDEAAKSVETWLETLGVRPEERKLRLTLQILQKARQRRGNHDPQALAMETAFEVLENWALSIFPEASRERAVVQALVALEGSFPVERAADLVLRERLSSETTDVLRRFSPGDGPEIRLSRMTARGIRYGPMEAIAQETWHKFAWAPIFRALLLWAGIFFLLLFLLGPKPWP